MEALSFFFFNSDSVLVIELLFPQSFGGLCALMCMKLVFCLSKRRVPQEIPEDIEIVHELVN